MLGGGPGLVGQRGRLRHLDKTDAVQRGPRRGRRPGVRYRQRDDERVGERGEVQEPRHDDVVRRRVDGLDAKSGVSDDRHCERVALNVVDDDARDDDRAVGLPLLDHPLGDGALGHLDAPFGHAEGTYIGH